MDPAGTVDSFSSSSSSLPTPNPHSSTHSSSLPSSAGSGMAGQEITLAELASQFQQLMAVTAQMQQQLTSLVPRMDSGVHPVDPAPRAEGPVDAPIQAVQSESASAAPAAPAVSSPSSSPHSSTPVVNLKVATPDTFNGNLAKSEEFINSLYLYFYGKQGMTDEQKITFALSYMKGGTAGQWSRRKIKQYSKSGGTLCWDTFLADFRQSFSDPDPKGTARHKLRILKQGTGSADEYVASFRELMDDTGYNDDALVEMFEKGLSRLLVDRIYTLPDLPETLDEWISQALKFDRLHRRREEKSRHAASTHTSSQPKPPSHQSNNPPRQAAPPAKPPPSTSSSSSDVVPMEVDSSRKRAMPRICYRCRQPGHIARDCQSRVDINAMDYDSIKAHIRKELEEESKAKEAKETQDF